MGRYNSQEDARFGMILFDQWGRRYYAEMEKETLYPTGPIQPLFKAPAHIDGKYLRPYGRNAPNRLHVDLDGLERDLSEKHEKLERRVRKILMKNYPGWGKKSPPPEVIDLVYGDVHQQPMPIEVVWAMRQGNRWVPAGRSDAPWSAGSRARAIQD